MTSVDAKTPTLDVERELLAAGTRYLIAVDEVGRGALAGPVAVGMVVIDAAVAPFPVGLRDSKLLAQAVREELAPRCAAWGLHSAVGEATPAEIDEHGIVTALGLAGWRALGQLSAGGAAVDEASVLLDGNHDWLSPVLERRMSVTTRVKADLACASVAAASVIAKVHRDRLMVALHETFPAYGWASNKGYGSAAHLAALAQFGASDHHRRTWLHGAAAAID
ncbi:ribonuclease HII [Gryllotalpicola reticulitermitis]|uniref:Ribonuclease n=1 Tax=Gryllotalpicola reticulitermitis TaxID=1184153 RepID=A0ABV8Q3B7_9MICO